jgi:hypothetical protein
MYAPTFSLDQSFTLTIAAGYSSKLLSIMSSPVESGSSLIF